MEKKVKTTKAAKVTKTTKKELSAKDRKKVTGGKTNRNVMVRRPLSEITATIDWMEKGFQFGARWVTANRLEQQLLADGYKPEEVKEILEQIQNEEQSNS